jgi:hypothetical protein
MNWAHLHLMLIHFPILGALLIVGVLALALYRKSDALVLLALEFIILIGVVTIPTYLTGEPSEDRVEHLPGVSEVLISKHESAALFGLITTEIMTLIACVALWNLYRTKSASHRALKVLLAVSLVNAATITWVSNLGGQIRHTEIRSTGVSETVRSSTESRTRNQDGD